MAIQSPVSLDEAKEHLRVTHTDDDQYISALLLAATSWAEKYQSRTYITRARTMYLDSWESVIRPPYPPLVSVTSIKYYDTGGTQQTLAAAAYRVDAVTEPGRITEAYNYTWPDIRDMTNAIEIIYQAGYGTAGAVPDEIKAAIKMIVEQMYKDRGMFSEDNITKDTENAAKMLLWIDKMVNI